MSRRKHDLSLPQVDDPDQARQVRRQETLHQPRKRAELARLRDERLQIALGRKNPVEFG
jgi:hypothetical protein